MALSDTRLYFEERPRLFLVRALHWKEPMAVKVTFRVVLADGAPVGDWVTKVFRLPGAPPGSLDNGVWISAEDL